MSEQAFRFEVGKYYCHLKSGGVALILAEVETYMWGAAFIGEVNMPMMIPQLKAIHKAPGAVRGWAEIDKDEFIGRSHAMASVLLEAQEKQAAKQKEGPGLPIKPDDFQRRIAAMREDPETRDQIVALECGHEVRWPEHMHLNKDLPRDTRIQCDQCKMKPFMQVVK
jgi:hypothetical protein